MASSRRVTTDALFCIALGSMSWKQTNFVLYCKNTMECSWNHFGVFLAIQNGRFEIGDDSLTKMTILHCVLQHFAIGEEDGMQLSLFCGIFCNTKLHVQDLWWQFNKKWQFCIAKNGISRSYRDHHKNVNFVLQKIGYGGVEGWVVVFFAIQNKIF